MSVQAAAGRRATSDSDVQEIAGTARTVAVLGIKTEAQVVCAVKLWLLAVHGERGGSRAAPRSAGHAHASQAAQPAFYVPQYLQQAGVEVVPLPVFYPDATHILSKPVLRKVSELQQPVDVLVMFR